MSVRISAYVHTAEVSMENRDLKVDMYFRQFWTDPRLMFAERPWLRRLKFGAETSQMDTSTDLNQLIWTPDTIFVNSTEHQRPDPLESLITISGDGEVMLSRRLTVTTSCTMDLMDSQLCTLEIRSKSTTADIHYFWAHGDNSVARNENSTHFDVLSLTASRCNASLSSEEVPSLVMEFKFAGLYSNTSNTNSIINRIIPVALSAVILWFSFLV